jgi:hypothetical protein
MFAMRKLSLCIGLNVKNFVKQMRNNVWGEIITICCAVSIDFPTQFNRISDYSPFRWPVVVSVSISIVSEK